MTKNYSHQTKNKTYHQGVQIILTKTKIIIRKYAIFVFLFFGLLAAFIQVITPSTPEDIKEARYTHREARNLRDQHRKNALLLLEEIAKDSTLNEEVKNRISVLIEKSNKSEKNSKTLFEELNKVKAKHKIRGFSTLNSFLDGIGNPIFILMLGVVFSLLYFYGENTKWKELSTVYLLALFICVFVSAFYLYWALVPKSDIDRFYYLIGLFVLSFITAILVYVVASIINKKRQKSNNLVDTVITQFMKDNNK